MPHNEEPEVTDKYNEIIADPMELGDELYIALDDSDGTNESYFEVLSNFMATQNEDVLMTNNTKFLQAAEDLTAFIKVIMLAKAKRELA